MKIIENLFGEFIDSALGIDIVNEAVPYKLFAGHSIGFYLFIGLIVSFCVATIFSKRFRKIFF